MGRKRRAKRERRTQPALQQPKQAVVPETVGEPGHKPTETKSGLRFPGIGIELKSATPAIALCLLVAVCYLPAIEAGFVWDDALFLAAEPVQDAAGIWDIWFEPSSMKEAEGHYWPLVYTTFWIEHKLWGFEPLGFHVVNILLHIVNTLLLYRVLLLLPVPGAWLIAAVFTVHPMRVESVAWVIERKDLLSGLFYLAAALGWLLYARSGRSRLYLVSLGAFGLALLSKSVAVTFPAALVIWHWWKAGRLGSAEWARVVPFFLLALAITAADLAHYRSLEDISFDYSFVERLLIASQAVWFYAAKIAWPVGLAGIYPLWDVQVADPVGWACFIGGLAVAGTLWILRARIGRAPMAGALFFLVTLSPTLGFVDYGFMQFSLVADRFQYLAGIGFIGLAVGTGAQYTRNLPGRTRRWAIPLAGVLIAALGATTWRHAGIYRDDQTFFSHVARHNPNAPLAHFNLGNALRDQGRHQGAVTAYQTALELDPEHSGSINNLGLSLTELGWFEEAEAAFQRGLEFDPEDTEVLNNLGLLKANTGQNESAERYYRKALEIDPNNATYMNNLGLALVEQNRLEEAERYYRTALDLDPGRPDTVGNLSLLLAKMNRDQELRAFLAEHGSGSAESGGSHLQLGDVLRSQGRLEDSIAAYQAALSETPGHAPTLIGLGLAFEGLGKIDEAARQFELASASGKVPEAQIRLAAARVAQERFEEALVLYRELRDLDVNPTLAVTGMGKALLGMGRHDDALRHFSEAIDSTSDWAATGIDPAQVHLDIGLAYEQSGRIDQAASSYEQALAADPNQKHAMNNLALMRTREGRLQEALDLYDRALKIDQKLVNAHIGKGVALLNMNRLEAAIESFESALEIDPTLELAKANLATAREVMRQRSGQ